MKQAKQKQESFVALHHQMILAYAKEDGVEIKKVKMKFKKKLRSNYRGITARGNPKISLNPRVHKIGSKVRGQRKGSAGHDKIGIIIDCYSTLNRASYKNPCYVVKCEDGKIRSYQHVIQEVS